MTAARAPWRLGSNAAGAVLLVLACACAGGPGTPDGPVVNSPGSGAPPPTGRVDVQLTVSVPLLRRGGMRPNYVSPNTRSLTIGLVTVRRRSGFRHRRVTVHTVRAAHGCKTSGGALVCTATISGAQGSDKFAVTTYAGTNATGAVLSVGSVEAQIGGQGKIGVNALSIAIDGVIASLRLRLAPKVTPRGKPATAHVSLDAFDASGAAIVGPSDFQLPIALTIQGDATHAFRLHAMHESGESLTIVKPTDKIELEYDGDKQASPITVQADVTGPQDPTASAQFGLHGKPPPPPLGTIYVLNLGPNDGRSASVTEYDGSPTATSRRCASCSSMRRRTHAALQSIQRAGCTSATLIRRLDFRPAPVNRTRTISWRSTRPARAVRTLRSPR